MIFFYCPQFCVSVSFPLDKYVLTKPGSVCGEYPADQACWGCSLDQCAEHSKKNNSIAFSYRASGSKWCRLCDANTFANAGALSEWNVYVRGKHMIK